MSGLNCNVKVTAAAARPEVALASAGTNLILQGGADGTAPSPHTGAGPIQINAKGDAEHAIAKSWHGIIQPGMISKTPFLVACFFG
jgi:hypothetical protein